MPALHADHFVVYVLNLKKRRYEFLTSLNSYKRVDAFEVLGDRLMKEATSYITMQYHIKGMEPPYIWTEFQWTNPKVPQQPDKVSCGVFAMKFLEEWDGGDAEMPTFTGWNSLPKKMKLKKVAEIRVNLCVQILINAHNDNLPELQNKAAAYGVRICQEFMQDGLKANALNQPRAKKNAKKTNQTRQKKAAGCPDKAKGTKDAMKEKDAKNDLISVSIVSNIVSLNTLLISLK